MYQLTIDAGARSDLVLPLGGHDLSVGARDVDAGVETGLVVSLDNIAAEHLASSDTTVVRTLGSWETVLGPSVRPAAVIEESVLLLETEPETFVLVLLHENGGGVAEVVLVRLSVAHPGLAHDEDVGPTTEGVVVDGDRAKVDIGVVARGLAGRGAVEVPLGEVLDLDVEIGNKLARLILLGLCLDRL